MQTANFPLPSAAQIMTMKTMNGMNHVGQLPVMQNGMMPTYVQMNGMAEPIMRQLSKGKIAVGKRVTSSLEKKVVRDSFDMDKKKRNQRVIAKSPVRETADKKHRETEPKKSSPKVKQMPLTQIALQEMNRIYFLQKMNRVREWVNQDQTDCLYPVFQF